MKFGKGVIFILTKEDIINLAREAGIHAHTCVYPAPALRRDGKCSPGWAAGHPETFAATGFQVPVLRGWPCVEGPFRPITVALKS
jgi:hypothetical protein